MSEARELDLAQPKRQDVATATDRPVSIMDIISRAVTDPNMDVDKLERLIALSERAQERESKAAYYAALSEMQDELPAIQERGEIVIRQGSPGQRYALWEDINKAIKPVLKEHGFALSFRTGISEKGITVTGILSHSAGHAEETTIHLPADTSGSKNAVQAVGSSTSYGKRYTTAALLNLTTTGDDDDAHAAGGVISADQAKTIRELLERMGKSAPKFCAYFGIEAVPDLPAKDYARAISMINIGTKADKK